MGAIRTAASQAFRNYETQDVPSTGEHNPTKTDSIALFALVEDQLLAAAEGSGYQLFETAAEAEYANLDDGTWARVVADDQSPPVNGYYQQQGSSLVFIAPNPDEVALEAAADAQAIADELEGILGLIEDRVVGPVNPDGTGTGGSVANSATYFWPSALSTEAAILTKVEAGSTSGVALSIVVAHVEGDGSLTKVSAETVVFAAGAASATVEIEVPAGAIVGAQLVSGATWQYDSGTIPNAEEQWYTAGAVTTSTAKTISTSNGAQVRYTLAGEVTGKARAAYAGVAALEAQVGDELTGGWPTVADTGASVPAGYTIIPKTTQATSDAYVSRLEIACSGAGTVAVIVVEDNGDGTLDLVSSHDVTVADGLNDVALVIPMATGQYAGVSGGPYLFTASGNSLGVAVFQTNAQPTTATAYVDGTPHRFELLLHVLTGLEGAVYAAGAGASTGAGFDVLADADETGVDDATDLFDGAVSSHPNPYVRPGDFSVTAVPTANGSGLWGPGKISVDDDRFFIPRAPAILNLYEGARAALMEHIGAADVIGLIGDSISHFAYAGDGEHHWLNRFTRFLNLGVAADEPIMTALRPSSTYTPDFYGVTTSGTVSTGANGPLGESLVLASGASLSFDGAYEQVDVFYTRQAGAGSLAFKFNGGASFHTVNANGATDLDRFSAAPATGHSGSGTYSIAASGGAVEITGLVRLGVKAADSPPRLRTGRFAHGSYSFPSFGAAAITSITKQATYAGGVLVPILALGINDSFGTDPDDIADNVTAVLDLLEAHSVPRIFALPPVRPGAGWEWGTGLDFDHASGAIRRIYRQRGVHVFPSDMVDWANLGLLADQLHFGPEGFDLLTTLVLEDLAALR